MQDKVRLAIRAACAPIIALVLVVTVFFAVYGVIARPFIPTNQEELQAIGLLGQHQIRSATSHLGTTAYFSGDFTIATGAISGHSTTERQLQFAWSPADGSVVFTTLPFRLFRFVLDKQQQQPTVEFIFREDYLSFRNLTAYSPNQKSNPNYWLSEAMVRDGYFRVAIIRISEADLEKEPFLPK